jgi:hypothetical protein
MTLVEEVSEFSVGFAFRSKQTIVIIITGWILGLYRDSRHRDGKGRGGEGC